MVADKTKIDRIVDDSLKYKSEIKGDIATKVCPVLVTERLVLRAPHEEDLDAITNLANNIRIAEMLTRLPHPYTFAHAREFIEGVRTGEIGNCIYAITQAETGIFMGTCAIHHSDEEGRIEIGYWLGEPYWGHGYATEAVQALVDLAFRVSDIECLYASFIKGNIASRNVLAKLGFNYVDDYQVLREGHGQVALERYGLKRDAHMHSLSQQIHNK